MQDDSLRQLAASVQRSEREQAIRKALVKVRREGDRTSERILCAWADDLYVSRAHERAADRGIRQLRRRLRNVA